MSFFLNVASTYHVDFEPTTNLKDEYEAVNLILHELCPYAIFNDDEEWYSTRIQIHRQDLMLALGKIAREHDKYQALFEEMSMTTNKPSVTIDDIAKAIEFWLLKADTSHTDDMVQLWWD